MINYIASKFETSTNVLLVCFTGGHQPLPWETRLKVAIGAARCLSLFQDLKILVTHENVKSSSILLDDVSSAISYILFLSHHGLLS